MCSLPTGKGLGGSSVISSMMYLRGSANDFNEWAKITNDSVWSYSSVLEVFKKSENYHGFCNQNGKYGEYKIFLI